MPTVCKVVYPSVIEAWLVVTLGSEPAGGKRKGIWPALFVQLETLESVLLKPLNTLVIR